MEDDKYPHWKDALFGDNNAVANIRCAIHYVFWHSVYAIIGIVGAIAVAFVKAGKAIAPYLGPLAVPVARFFVWIGDGIHYIMEHRYTETVFRYGFYLFIALGIIYVVVLFIVALLTDPLMLLGTIGAIIGAFIALLGVFVVVEKLKNPTKDAATGAASGLRTAGEKATKTPGIRRVYGECPVSMKQAPKWFDNIFAEDEYVYEEDN